MNAIKRTRRYVHVRMTPDQARAWAKSVAGADIPTRKRNELTDLAYQAARAADTEPPAAPTPTSFGKPARFKDGTN